MESFMRHRPLVLVASLAATGCGVGWWPRSPDELTAPSDMRSAPADFVTPTDLMQPAPDLRPPPSATGGPCNDSWDCAWSLAPGGHRGTCVREGGTGPGEHTWPGGYCETFCRP